MTITNNRPDRRGAIILIDPHRAELGEVANDEHAAIPQRDPPETERPLHRPLELQPGGFMPMQGQGKPVELTISNAQHTKK
jgi:hypothetical protein